MSASSAGLKQHVVQDSPWAAAASTGASEHVDLSADSTGNTVDVGKETRRAEQLPSQAAATTTRARRARSRLTNARCLDSDARFKLRIAWTCAAASSCRPLRTAASTRSTDRRGSCIHVISSGAEYHIATHGLNDCMRTGMGDWFILAWVLIYSRNGGVQR